MPRLSSPKFPQAAEPGYQAKDLRRSGLQACAVRSGNSGAGHMIVCRYLALNEVPTHENEWLRMPQQLTGRAPAAGQT